MAMCCLVVFVLFLTVKQMYATHCYKISIGLSLFLCAMSLALTNNVKSSTATLGGSGAFDNDISPAGLYTIYLSIILLLYTAVPLPLYGTLLIGVTYSALFECLLCYRLPERSLPDLGAKSSSVLLVNVVLHVCIHVVGVHTVITTQVSPCLSDARVKLIG